MKAKVVVLFLLGLLFVTGQSVAGNLNKDRWDFLDLLSRNADEIPKYKIVSKYILKYFGTFNNLFFFNQKTIALMSSVASLLTT